MSDSSQRRREWAISDVWAIATYFEIEPARLLDEPPVEEGIRKKRKS